MYSTIYHSLQWNMKIKLFIITFQQGVYFPVHSLESIRTNFQNINKVIISLMVVNPSWPGGADLPPP